MKPQPSLVYDLEFMLSIWKLSRDLFHGGCCFAAAVIASELEKRDIDYNVVVYTPEDILTHVKNINSIANDELCLHVAIELKDVESGEDVVLGGEFEEPGYVFREYVKTDAEELMYTYRHNEWNNHYNIGNNPDFIKHVRKIFAENE